MQNKYLVFPLVLVTLVAHQTRAANVDFEDKTLTPNSYYNGADGAAGFSSRGAQFNNSYNTTYAAWGGWSYSNVVDTTTPGYGNQYASYAGGGSDTTGSTVPGGIYAIGYGGGPLPYINLPAGQTAQTVRLTNTTYAGLSMKNGDPFAKKFGGATGNDPDFFKVTLTGYSTTGAVGTTTGSVDFYLADYRFADNAKDYIVNSWTSVDLTPLAAAQSIGFTFTSSDTGIYGINTPTYVALDNLTTVPEPACTLAIGCMIGWIAARRRR
jgi:hypothetical protein